MAFLPQPGLLRRYAAEHLLVPLDGVAGSAVASNYSPAWRRLGSAGGRLYGVWFKAADKSLIWYNEGVFEREGVARPAASTGSSPLAHRLARSGVPAFSVGGQDGWTLADWFSNLYLRLAGPGPVRPAWPRTRSGGPIPRSSPRSGSWPGCWIRASSRRAAGSGR